MEGLSINYIDSTNADVVITYTPSNLVTRYSYRIIKNNEYSRPTVINNNSISTFTFNETGTYKIEITEYDENNIQNVITSGEYKIDKEAPILNISENKYKLKANQSFDYMKGVTATDIVDGDLTNSITTNIDTIDFKSSGIKTLKYSVSDKAGNITTEEVYLTISRDNTILIRTGQFGLLFILLLFIIFISKYIRSIKLEKRFSKYTINSSKNKSISLFDNLYIQYKDFLNKLSKILSNSVFIKNSSKRYNKYVEAFTPESNSMNIMAKKVVVGFIFIVVAIFARLIDSKILTPIEMLISFIVGFYTLDFIYFYKYKKYNKKIENDLLNAITVMNNAFKAGMSISQAVELVSKNLKGPIAKEFKKISLDLSLGLDVEVAFKRFSDRIKTTDAVYLTSSLAVLNKTGGNIIKVFDSIEKTMFSKKKLEHELKSLTSSSRLIMYVLMVLPILFILFISIINRNYFSILFTNPLGIVLIGIMLMIYITYIIVVSKVMKVRGIK